MSATAAMKPELPFRLPQSLWAQPLSKGTSPCLSRLVKDIRAITIARGDGIKKVTETEKGALKKLRKFDTT